MEMEWVYLKNCKSLTLLYQLIFAICGDKCLKICKLGKMGCQMSNLTK